MYYHKAKSIDQKELSCWLEQIWSQEQSSSILEVLCSGQIFRGDHIMTDERGHFRIDEVTISPLDGTSHFVILRQDITNRRRAESYDNLRGKILSRIAGNDSLSSILKALVYGVEEVAPTSLCSLLMLSSDRQHLGEGIAPSLPDFYNQAIDGIQIGLGVGSCGTASFLGERVIVSDIQTHPYWAPYKELAAKAGLAACWSEPVRSSKGEIFGTFAIYHSTPHTPNESDIDLIEQAARLAGIAIEHTRTLQALSKREILMHTLVQTIPDLIWLKDTDGVYLACNPVFEQFFGARQADILGKSDYDFVSKELADFFRKNDQKAIAKGSPSINEEELTFAWGGYKGLFETIKVPVIDDDGKLSGVLGVAREVTLRKKLEQNLKQAKIEAENSARATSNFLANMSHEIRTPMNAIIGLTDLALRTSLNPRQQDYLTKVHVAANSLLGLINDILDLTKIQSGKLQLESIPFSLDNVLDDLSSLMTIQIEEKGLELLFWRNPEVPIKLIGDPLRLSQVLTNLTNNAKKFTESGDIIVSTELVEVNGENVTLRFSVSDSGVGITQEQMSKLFKPFSQADESVTRRYGGTGLGLTISRQLVEMMGGQIWIESEPGVGTKVSFEAKFQLAKEDKKEIPKILDDLCSLKTLVVDDNPHALEIFKAQLEQFSFRAETCNSPEQAFEKLLSADDLDPYRLVLMDYRMPSMDGITASHKIKHELGLKVIPRVILVTAASRLAGEEGLYRKDFDELLAKPVNASLLLDVVMEVFGHPRQSRHRFDRELDLQAIEPIKGARILLAEDNLINQQVASEILSQAGFLVEIANNGLEALELLRKRQYNCVLMDVQMPIMDGYTATVEIRKEPAWKDLPVLAMTANVLSEDRAKASQVGMNDHIAKPIVARELFSTLLKWIEPGNYQPIVDNNSKQIEENIVIELPEELHGIDIPLALANIGDNRKLLQKLLIDFLHDHAGDCVTIASSIEQKDFATAERLAHTLKGVSHALGAMSLRFQAAELERVLKHNEDVDISALVKALEAELNPVMEGLARWHSSNTVTKPAKISSANALTLCDELEKLLEEMDPDAGNKADELAAALNGDLDLTVLIAEEAANFEFESALAKLKQLRQVIS